MLSTFLAVDYFKIPQIIFFTILYTILYFTMSPQYLCSNGLPTVYHILTPSPTEMFYGE